MMRTTALPAIGAKIATNIVIGFAATLLFACADDSTPTSPAIAPNTASAGRIPSLTPDRIVFMSDRENYGTTFNFDIYSMLPDGSGVTRLTSAYDNQNPALSPDGKHVVFASNRDNGLYDIYVMKSDGSNVTRLTTTTAANYKPTWSADGSKIVFTTTRDAPHAGAVGLSASWEIYIMNADGSNLKRLTNNAFGEWDPQLSPDGTHIVFTSDRDHPGSSWTRDLYIMNADGTNVHRLTSQDGTTEAPNYDPSGNRITYDVMDGSAPGIYVLSGHAATRIVPNVGSTNLNFTPTWSPDGKQIAYTHFTGASSQIFKMNADGSSPKQLTRDPYYAQRSDWGR